MLASSPRLVAGVIDFWRADLDGVDPSLEQTLDSTERARAARFARERDRRRWALARGILRVLLASYLDTDPHAPRFYTGAHGKPAIDAPDCPVHFNVSHAGALAVFAFALRSEVGVDVEVTGSGVDTVAVSRRVFGDTEAQRLRGLGVEPREREFLRMWVRHEAALKCRGTGFAEPTGATASTSAAWTADLDLGPTAVAAIAADRPPGTVRRFIVPS
jgi:4'-phosphopantetheinyl transferase